jgi:hypothetical protein
MAQPAHVRSVEAIEAFRANLLVYAAKARPVLEDACDEVLRTRDWLERDRWTFWENQLRRRTRTLDEAQAALFSARLSNLREARTAEQIAVVKARAAVNEAQEKLARIRKWRRDFDHLVQPLLKELEQLRAMLAADLPKAAAHLAQVVKTLDAYLATASEKEHS